MIIMILIIIIIIIIIIITLFHILHPLMMFPVFSYVTSQLVPLAQKHIAFLSTCAVPSIADSWALAMMSCHVLASFDIVPNAPTTMGMPLLKPGVCALPPMPVLGICLLFHFASSQYSGQQVLTVMSIKIHSLSFFSKSVMSGILCYSFLSA